MGAQEKTTRTDKDFYNRFYPINPMIAHCHNAYFKDKNTFFLHRYFGIFLADLKAAANRKYSV